MPQSEVNTTPSSRAEGDKTFSKGSQNRVCKTAPDGKVCLVEHRHEINAVQFCHLYPRRLSHKDKMNNIEWFWGMKNKTLNLDSRYNVFCAGATLHMMYDSSEPSWGLIPEEQIVRTYFQSLTVLGDANRDTFPVIDNGIFYYRLVPLTKDAKNTCITRSDTIPPTPESTKRYFYPFDDLPLLKCHAHPRFVILSLGLQLTAFGAPYLEELAERYPILVQIRRIYAAWTSDPPAFASHTPSYVADSDDDSDDDGNDRDWNSDEGTAPRRIKRVKLDATGRGNALVPKAGGGAADSASRLSHETLIEFSSKDEKGWNKDTITHWSTGVSQCISTHRNCLNLG